MPYHHRRLILAFALLAVLHAPATAQVVPDESTVTLAPVEVTSSESKLARLPAATAGFDDTSVLDTPFSVGVIDASLLADQRLVSIEDVLKYEPSATPSYSSGSYNYFNVRGNIPANLIDGERLWRRARYSLENVERIEFLKGPAALRGAFGGPGGAINLITKRPLDTASATVSAEADTWGALRGTVDATLRPSDDWGLRVNLAQERLDDQWDLTGDRTFVSLANDYRLSEATRLTFDLDYLDDDRIYSGEYNTDTAGNVLALDPETLYGQPWATQKTKSLTTRVGLVHEINPDWTARLQVGAYRTEDVWTATYMSPVQANGDYDLFWYGNDGTPNERLGLSTTASLSGRADTGSVTHDLTFAAQSAYETSDEDQSAVYALVGTSNIFNPVTFARPAAPAAVFSKNYTREISLVATDEAHLTKQWSVLFGGRYSHYKAQENDYETSAFVPVGAVIFKPVPRLTTYVSYSESLEPGGTASAPALNAGDQLDARESNQVELGAKLALFDERLLLTAAAFSIEADYYGYINSANLYVQDGLQDIQGVELGATGRVTENLRVILGGMLLDATLKNTGDPVQDNQQSPGVPKGTANLSLDYKTPWLRGFAVNCGVFYTGPFTSYNYDLGQLISLPGHTTADVGVRYRFHAARSLVTTRLNVSNVFDKQAWQPSFYPIEPVTAKLSVEITF